MSGNSMQKIKQSRCGQGNFLYINQAYRQELECANSVNNINTYAYFSFFDIKEKDKLSRKNRAVIASRLSGKSNINKEFTGVY